ncbi:MAG: glutamate-1-semialdehyde 2,1-aminomutase, partial [Planctomycetota bacterium]|nr:glutamate-1-semialdehyde 2,1-aminomutase [Planctomycetota bacterium]
AEQASRGTSFGAPCTLETELATRIVDRVPACERVRFVNSGTEATMSAIRLARGATGRDRIVKIAGCYHGHVDSLLVQAGSGVLTLGIPGSPGVPEALAGLTHVVPFNDLATVRTLFADRGGEIAALIVEPVAGNMGVVPPDADYLQGLKSICEAAGALLIFDEVMTGFRVARGGAVERYGVVPDLICFGKVIGGGLPVGAYGGRADVMEQIAPTGPVYQAGTLSGNPLAMRAGIETLDRLNDPGVYDALEHTSAALEAGMREAAAAAGAATVCNRVGSMMTWFFAESPVRDYESAAACDTDAYAAFFHAMRRRGIYFAPSAFEAAFVSTAHGEKEIEATLEAARAAFPEVLDAHTESSRC